MTWDEKLRQRFADKIVNKALARRVIQRQLPRFVTEYLLARYADRGETEALRVVNDTIQKHFPEPRHAERVVFDLAQQVRCACLASSMPTMMRVFMRL